jgi:virginiamycin B lyase
LFYLREPRRSTRSVSDFADANGGALKIIKFSNSLSRLLRSAMTSITLMLGISAWGQQATPGSGQPPAAGASGADSGTHVVRPPRVVRPGVAQTGVSFPLTELHPAAIFPVEGSPDWSVVTNKAVWVSSARVNHVVQLLPDTNTVGLTAEVQKPCSGLAEGFGSIWVPSCGAHSVVRLDRETGKAVAEIAADPANSEGGITVGDGAVWIVTKPSTLVQIDPKTNKIAASIELPSGSENPAFYKGYIWVSSFEHDQLLKIDPQKRTVVAAIPVGPKPRFLTAGANSIWTLNQGDGTITRIDVKTGKQIATIPCGIPGAGGEITFGADSVWAAVFDFPLTQVDTKTNTVVKQWAGQGGDGVRFGLGSVWLSNLRQGNVWRISPNQ